MKIARSPSTRRSAHNDCPWYSGKVLQAMRVSSLLEGIVQWMADYCTHANDGRSGSYMRVCTGLL